MRGADCKAGWGCRKICRRWWPVLVSEEFRGLRMVAPDSCICLNVLEHIQDDAEAMSSMASILPKGGVVVLIVPAFPCSCTVRLTGTSATIAATPGGQSQAGASGGTEAPEGVDMNSVGWLGW